MASMGVRDMRTAIKSAYPGIKWESKVNAMPDNQVVAIYNHFIRDGVFNKIRTPGKASDPNFHQMTLWEIGLERRPNAFTSGNRQTF